MPVELLREGFSNMNLNLAKMHHRLRNIVFRNTFFNQLTIQRFFKKFGFSYEEIEDDIKQYHPLRILVEENPRTTVEKL